MEPICTRCHKSMQSAWTYCAHCGHAIPHPADAPVEHLEHEKAPVTGAFGGLYFGFLAVPLLLIVGVMLCLTGLGAILGIPMIAAAILAPLAGPLFGMGAAKGKVL